MDVDWIQCAVNLAFSNERMASMAWRSDHVSTLDWSTVAGCYGMSRCFSRDSISHPTIIRTEMEKSEKEE